MKILTIEGIDPSLEQSIKIRAARQHQSVSQWIVTALRQVLETEQESDNGTYHDLDHLAGGWSKEETEEFLQNIEIFEKIDESIWK
jgi:plasmid stability protein